MLGCCGRQASSLNIKQEPTELRHRVLDMIEPVQAKYQVTWQRSNHRNIEEEHRDDTRIARKR
ncbi:hypothetical protein B0H12DRAFT_1097563 [Mycena haematopus]|nr:hypothetical protein B0H12DRAFT_1097563 [Mycena haematopus]